MDFGNTLTSVCHHFIKYSDIKKKKKVNSKPFSLLFQKLAFSKSERTLKYKGILKLVKKKKKHC